tara:strand:+ start:95 stop:277 length:183 start_codon:yes stop_codon:yes gene_type:complete
MLDQSKKVLDKARKLGAKKDYQGAINVLNENIGLCDIDSEYFSVAQSRHIFWTELLRESE